MSGLHQDTTTNTDINYLGGPIGGHGGRTTGKTGRDADEDPKHDRERDVGNHADVDASERGRTQVRLQSMPNGEYPIRNAAELKAVIREWQTGLVSNRYSGAEIQRHIIRRARDLKLVALLPDAWGVSLEIMSEGLISEANIFLTIEQLESESRNFGAAQRRKYASQGIALPDGSFPIPDKDALRRAIKLVGKGGAGAKKHIIKRAKALGATSMLPDTWGVAAEEKEEEFLMAEVFQSFLVLEGKNVPQPLVLEDNGVDKTMKVRVPFYIGDSITHAPGFDKRIFFPTSLLQEIVKDGKDDIAAGIQPLTVYARHAHAADADYLPIGGVSDLKAEGSVGYAILDIEPTTYGKDAQVLLRAKPPKLNAVSLRSGKSNFEMERVEVNGEMMYRPKKLRLSGIDFAPDSPAMKTYGIEILAAENLNVKLIPNSKEDKNNKVPDKLTLEAVKAEPEIVAEIERPIVARLDVELKKNETLTAENTSLKEKLAKVEIDAFVLEIASKHPKRDEVLPILTEMAKTCKSKDEFSTKVFPILMEALQSAPKQGEKLKPPEKSPEDKLRDLFGAGSGGRGVVRLENGEPVTEEEDETELKGEHVGVLQVPN
jgi:hypothetical protein